jgi:hypothetical protein
MTLAPFSRFHCVNCGFVGKPKLSKTGQALTALWLVTLVAGIFVWPLLIVWALATAAAVFVFEKLCCCASCGHEDVVPVRK